VFGAPVVLTSSLRDGSLRGEAKARGVDVLLYEAGEGLRFDEVSIRAGLMGLLRVLHHEGMIARRGIPPAKAAPMMVRSSTWLRAPAGGLVRMYRSEGDVVAEGDLLAAVADPFGAEDVELLAPSPGIIVGRAVMPIVNEGDALFHLGELPPTLDAEAAMDDHAEATAEALFDEDEII
ncbi:MAG: succinylglutamate desuccinylase/aspartoacylase family protein, partial [Pseudomonadota bacterium]